MKTTRPPTVLACKGPGRKLHQHPTLAKPSKSRGKGRCANGPDPCVWRPPVQRPHLLASHSERNKRSDSFTYHLQDSSLSGDVRYLNSLQKYKSTSNHTLNKSRSFAPSCLSLDIFLSEPRPPLSLNQPAPDGDFCSVSSSGPKRARLVRPCNDLHRKIKRAIVYPGGRLCAARR
jgi:hypothetical protein